MKRLVCEVCGGNEMIKKDGVFKCMGCGMNYSLEEIRKLLVVEEDILGSLKPDAKTQDVDVVIAEENAINSIELAQKAFDDTNYAEAEKLCNGIIACDVKNYDAWILKGKSIKMQSSIDNVRIVEAFDCILSAFCALDDAQKECSKDETVSLLKRYLADSVNIWLDRFTCDIPTEVLLDSLIESFNTSIQKLAVLFEKNGADGFMEYKSSFTNAFIKKTLSVCKSSWENIVGRNYYRQDFESYGMNWKTEGEDYTNDYRPESNEYVAFISGIDTLVKLLIFTDSLFDDNTTPDIRVQIYYLIMLFEDRAINALAFKRSGYVDAYYGGVRGFWIKDFSLTNEAVVKRREIASKYEKLRNSVNLEEQVRRIKEYWDAHPEEKQRLEDERGAILDEISEYNKQIKDIPDADLKERLEKQLEKLTISKAALGSFSGRERRELQKKIDELSERISAVSRRRDIARVEIENKIYPLKKRLDEINNELNREQ